MYAVQSEQTIRIYDSFLYRESIREIDGRVFDADDKAWVIPLTAKNAYTVGLLGATLDEELQKLAKSVTITKQTKKQPQVVHLTIWLLFTTYILPFTKKLAGIVGWMANGALIFRTTSTR